MHDDAMACELQNLHAWSKSSIKAAIMGIRPFFAPNMDNIDKRGITPDSIHLSSFFAGFYLIGKGDWTNRKSDGPPPSAAIFDLTLHFVLLCVRVCILCANFITGVTIESVIPAEAGIQVGYWWRPFYCGLYGAGRKLG